MHVYLRPTTRENIADVRAIGKATIGLLERRAVIDYPDVEELVALIHPDNHDSQHLAEAKRYTWQDEDVAYGDLLVYRKPVSAVLAASALAEAMP